jgi:ATP-dependent DNA ligase
MVRHEGEQVTGRRPVVDVEHDVLRLPEASAVPEPSARRTRADRSAPVVSDRIPEGPMWRYEPDWDGLRVVVRRRGNTVALLSQQGRPLDRYFPEVVGAVGSLPMGDITARGSIVVIRPDGFSFDLLRRRIHPSAARVAKVAGSWPATLILTDAIADGGSDLRGMDLATRRSKLWKLGERASITIASAALRELDPGEPVVISPITSFVSFAEEWLCDHDQMGRSGVIARHTDGRTMVRVRRLRTAACIVTGIRSGTSAPHTLRLAMDEEGELVEVGRTSALRGAAARRAAAEALATVRVMGESDGWIDLEPTAVCVVRYERLRRRRFRSAVGLVGWLPENERERCSIDQLEISDSTVESRRRWSWAGGSRTGATG